MLKSALPVSPRRLLHKQRSGSRPLTPHISVRIGQNRDASTSYNPTANRLRNIFYGSTLLILAAGGYIYFTDTRSSIHRYLFPPLLRIAYPDAEDAHHATISLLKELHSLGLHPRERVSCNSDSQLSVSVFGHRLANPIGISGGLDKDAKVPDALFALGPAIVEVGGVTGRPQEGNERPRVFRVPSEQAIINRYGLNSEGADAVAARLRQRLREFAYSYGLGFGEKAEGFVLDGGAGVPPGSLTAGRLLAVQIAKSKATPEHDLDAVVKDHVYCVEQLGRYADILVVNVSSPNTPGLRSLQSKDPLTKILGAVVEAANAVPRRTKPAVMVKVSPDEDSQAQVEGICEAVWASGVDGVIVGNTTKLRPEPLLQGHGLSRNEVEAMREQGGFSGPHLFDRTVHLVKMYRQILDQGPRSSEPSKDSRDGESKAVTKAVNKCQKTLFASGGITNGKQAMQVMNAGASVAMIYTTLVYNGAGTVSRIKEEMRKNLEPVSKQ
jgi:dihydroorotate dehydrogenase